MEFLPLLLIMALFLVPMMLMNNRQKKAQAKTREMQNAIGIGDEVRTYSGFYGLVADEYDDVVILETESGAQTKWARQSVAQKVDANGVPIDPSAAAAAGDTGSDDTEDGAATEAPRSGEGPDASTSDPAPYGEEPVAGGADTARGDEPDPRR